MVASSLVLQMHMPTKIHPIQDNNPTSQTANSSGRKEHRASRQGICSRQQLGKHKHNTAPLLHTTAHNTRLKRHLQPPRSPCTYLAATCPRRMHRHADRLQRPSLSHNTIPPSRLQRRHSNSHLRISRLQQVSSQCLLLLRSRPKRTRHTRALHSCRQQQQQQQRASCTRTHISISKRSANLSSKDSFSLSRSRNLSSRMCSLVHTAPLLTRTRHHTKGAPPAFPSHSPSHPLMRLRIKAVPVLSIKKARRTKRPSSTGTLSASHSRPYHHHQHQQHHHHHHHHHHLLLLLLLLLLQATHAKTKASLSRHRSTRTLCSVRAA